MKHKVKPNQQERGITLIALIITIIVLVILAAVTLNSIFGSNIIGLATNGAINYAEEQQKELGMLNDVSDLLGDITGDTDRPMSPSITLSGTKGNNDIYTSNVMVTISINKGLEQTGTIKLHYKINDGEEQITEEDVSFEVSEEGRTTITAWTENEKGNLSDNYETSFTINKTAPSTPTISLNGTEGENEYYITDVGVTISAGDATDVASIKYKVEEANPIAETEATGTTANFDITQDGTSTITAYIINNAGLTSEEITQVVNKDATNPSTATIAVSGEVGETSIAVTANGEDATSGVASYIFQYSTTSEKEGFTTALEVQNTANSCTYTYQGLASDTTYYLRVIVKDRAGNTKPSTAVNATTKTAELNFGEMTEEEINGEIGKYVDYTPESGSFTSSSTYNGSSNQSFETITTLNWRILKVEANTLTLISDTTANTGFTLSGANGYNNGVLLLNSACKEMYSSSDWATGRSIKIEDIEEYSNQRATLVEYNATPNASPAIYAQEKTGQLGRSEQTDYVTGTTGNAFSLNGKQTYYTFTMSTNTMTNSIYVTLFSSSTENWIASRCIDYIDSLFLTYFNFKIFCVSNSNVDAKTLEDSGTTSSYSSSLAIRPVVEIDLTKVKVGATGDGSSGNPYSITVKS